MLDRLSHVGTVSLDGFYRPAQRIHHATGGRVPVMLVPFGWVEVCVDGGVRIVTVCSTCVVVRVVSEALPGCRRVLIWGVKQFLVERAEEIVQDLRAAGLSVTYDESGNIGRRYRRQDEIGTPFCVTVDRDGLEGSGPDTATVRDRDTLAQARVPIDRLPEELTALRAGRRDFADLLDRYEIVAEQ
jgi:hypothetical protein